MHLEPRLVILFAVLLLLAIVASLARLITRRRPTQSHATTYEAIREFLSPAERSFFGVLQQAVTSNYEIFSKVRLADIIRPVGGSNRSVWQTAQNRIDRKHVDFVLCDSSQLNLVAVIELDDQSHERAERGLRDTFVDAALADARIPILRVSARQSYSPTQLREQIENLFRPPEKARVSAVKSS